MIVVSDHKILSDPKFYTSYVLSRFIYFMCLSVYMFMHHMYDWYLKRSKEGFEFPRTGVIGGWGLPCGHWN